MRKGFHVIIITAALLASMSVSGFAQRKDETQRSFNQLYEPLPVVMRLSYENFKSIKLLNAAILNYGGGESEFDKLVEDYAEASSLYFRNEYVASANKFTENEKNINETARRIAEQFRQMTEKIQKDAIKMKVKTTFKMALSGKQIGVHPAVDKALQDGGYSLAMANDLLVRSRPINAIYLYRRAKDNFFNVYRNLERQFKEQAETSMKLGRSNDMKYYTQEAKKFALPAEYLKDVADNNNTVYEKGNREREI